MLVTSIFSFSERNYNISVTSVLSSAITFNLDQSKIRSFGKELKSELRSKRLNKVYYYDLSYLNNTLAFLLHNQMSHAL